MSAKVLVLDFFSFVNIIARFTIARLLFEQRIFFDNFFLFKDIIEMKVNKFLVGVFFIALGLLVAFPLLSEKHEFW